MKINRKEPVYNNPLAFKAKFIHTEDLKQVAQWAVDNNKFDRLNDARKNIDRYFLQRRIKLELTQTEDGRPSVVFTRFTPKKNSPVIKSAEDYIQSAPMIYECSKKMNPFKYAYLKILKLANGAPDNRMFNKIVKGV